MSHVDEVFLHVLRQRHSVAPDAIDAAWAEYVDRQRRGTASASFGEYLVVLGLLTEAQWYEYHEAAELQLAAAATVVYPPETVEIDDDIDIVAMPDDGGLDSAPETDLTLSRKRHGSAAAAAGGGAEWDMADPAMLASGSDSRHEGTQHAAAGNEADDDEAIPTIDAAVSEIARLQPPAGEAVDAFPPAEPEAEADLPRPQPYGEAGLADAEPSDDAFPTIDEAVPEIARLQASDGEPEPDHDSPLAAPETDLTIPRRSGRRISEPADAAFDIDMDAELEVDDEDEYAPTVADSDSGIAIEHPDVPWQADGEMGFEPTVPRRRGSGSSGPKQEDSLIELPPNVVTDTEADATLTQPDTGLPADDSDLTIPRRRPGSAGRGPSETVVEAAAGSDSRGDWGSVPTTDGRLATDRDTLAVVGGDTDGSHAGMRPRGQAAAPVVLPSGSPSASSTDDAGAHHVGRYRIVGELGRGGMGAILVGIDRDLGREVAVKVMHDQRDEEQVVRFRREAQISGQLEHPNITPVYELAAKGGSAYFTMQVVRGDSLTQKLTALRKQILAGRGDRGFSLPERLDVFKKICEAMAYAHSRGVLHRDLKPDNVMVGQFGEVHVMDWGLARLIGEDVGDDGRTAEEREAAVAAYAEQAAADGVPRSGSTSGIQSRVAPTQHLDAAYRTIEGDVMGTPSHMAPEQARGEISSLDARTDIYSLGVILYEMLTLSRAFEGTDVREILERVKAGQSLPPREKVQRDARLWEAGYRVPAELEAVALKAMANKQEHRYQSAEEMRADIDAFLTGRALEAVDYSLLGLLAKFVQRNKAAVLGTAAAILLAVGVAVALVVVNEDQRRTQIADSLTKAESAVDEARKAISAHVEWQRQTFDDELVATTKVGFEAAQEKIQTAQGLYAGIRALDPNNAAMAAGFEVLEGLRAEITTQVALLDAEQQRIRAQRERGVQARRLALEDRADRVEQARRTIHEAEQALGRAGHEFAQAMATLHELEVQEERDAIRQRIIERFEDARTTARLAQDRLAVDLDDEYAEDPEFVALNQQIVTLRGEVGETESRIVERRVRVITEWTAAEEQFTRRLAATQSLERGEAQRARGQQAVDASDYGAAFGALLEALNHYSQALNLFEGMAGAQDGYGRSLVGMLTTLLLLAHVAIENHEFQVASTWISRIHELERQNAEADPAWRVDLGAELLAAIQQTGETLEQQGGQADDYNRHVADGDAAWADGAYARAAEYYERAIEAVQTIASFEPQVADLRQRVQQAHFEQRLREAQVHADNALWREAFDSLMAAREMTAEGDARRADVEMRRQQLVGRASVALMEQATHAFGEGTREGRTRARRALSTLLDLNPTHEPAQNLLVEVIAQEDLPSGFIYVRGGEATIGNADPSFRNPLRTTTVGPFQIAATEVSVAEYAQFVEAGGYDTQAHWTETGWQWLTALPAAQRLPADWQRQLDEPQRPVVGVSAHEALAYAAWRTATDDGRFRLPTEVEWELVARHTPRNLTGGNTYPWGAIWDEGILPGELRRIGSNSSDRSAFGVLDLAGNASEWVVRVDDETNRPLDGEFGLRGASNLMDRPLRQRFAVTQKRGFAGAGQRIPFAGIRLVREVAGR